MKNANKLVLTLAAVFMAVPAMAQDGGAMSAMVSSPLGLISIGIGIMMGLAVLGGTLGQSKAAATALDGIARNPAAADKFTVPLVLSLALMESLVLFAFLISFSIGGAVTEAIKQLK